MNKIVKKKKSVRSELPYRTFGKHRYTIISQKDTKQEADKKKKQVKDRYYVRVLSAPKYLQGNWIVYRSVESKIIKLNKKEFRRLSINMSKKQAEERAKFWIKHGYDSKVKPYKNRYSVLRSIKKR